MFQHLAAAQSSGKPKVAPRAELVQALAAPQAGSSGFDPVLQALKSGSINLGAADPTGQQKFSSGGEDYILRNMHNKEVQSNIDEFGGGMVSGMGRAPGGPSTLNQGFQLYKDQGNKQSNYAGKAYAGLDSDMNFLREGLHVKTDNNSYKKALAAALAMAGGAALMGAGAGSAGAAAGASATPFEAGFIGTEALSGAAGTGLTNVGAGVGAGGLSSVGAGGGALPPPISPATGMEALLEGVGVNGGLSAVTGAKSQLTSLLAKFGLSGKDAAGLLAALASSGGGGGGLPDLEYGPSVPMGGGTGNAPQRQMITPFSTNQAQAPGWAPIKQPKPAVRY